MLKIKPRPPFNFHLSAGIFSGDLFDGEYLCLIIRLDKKIALACMKSTGSVEKPDLTVDLESDEELSREDERRVIELLSSMMNLDSDLNAFYELTKTDPVLAPIVNDLRGLKVVHTQSLFEALVNSIVEQQIAFRIALKIERSLLTGFGDRLNARGREYHAFPTPGRLASLSVEELRNCGLSTRKAEYIRDLSEMVSDGIVDPESFRDYGRSEDIVNELSAIRGIGPWTAKMAIMRSMRRFEVLPVDDVGLRRCISHYCLDGRRISPQEANEISKAWGEWRGLVAYYLVRAEMLESR